MYFYHYIHPKCIKKSITFLQFFYAKNDTLNNKNLQLPIMLEQLAILIDVIVNEK